jgi:hypothetical protein
MKQKDVFKKIGVIIEELSDQYEYLETVPDDLNDLELELFVSNAHFLTDHIEILCKLNLQNRAAKRTPEKQETSHEQKYFEPVVQQMKPEGGKSAAKPEKTTFKLEKEPVKTEEEVAGPAEPENADHEKTDEQPVPEIDLAAEISADSYSFIMEEPETIRHELVLDESMNLDEDEDEKIEVINEPVKESKKTRVATPAPAEDIVEEVKEEKPKHEEPKTVVAPALQEDEVLTINQKMSSQMADKGTSRTDLLSIKPISDIKLAITLNDKLLYVKDLFNGYNLAYSEAIEILNRFNTFEEAQRFLKTNYVTKNNWESKPATTEKFYALLKRRYA